MKKILFTVFLLCITLLNAQGKPDSIIVVDKIPEGGLVLNKGWKFHAGDNYNWAQPKLNDDKWDSIDPTSDIYYLQKVREAELGWFRIKLHINKTILNQSLAFNLYQAGASEIYLNGRPIYRLGVVSKDFSKEKTLETFERPFSIKFDDTSTQVIAVRYSFNKRNFFISYLPLNICLKLTINNTNETFRLHEFDIGALKSMHQVILTLCALLGLMSLVLYFSYNAQKAYLYLSFYFFITVFTNILNLICISFYNLSTPVISTLYFSSAILGVLSFMA